MRQDGFNHDLGEAEVGDMPKRAVDHESEVSKKDKDRKEEEAVKELSAEMGSDEILELWKEYNARETREAKFVKDMDLIELCLQALKYEKNGRYDPEEENENFEEYDNLDEFFATSRERLQTDQGRKLFQNIKERYEKAKQE